MVTALPLYHIFALMVNFITYFSIGAENWLVPNPRDMDGFVEILRKARCTVFTGVNTLFGGLLMHPKIGEVDFTRLRVAIGGGAAVLPTTSAKWKALTGTDILEGYGLSETSPILTLNPMSADRLLGDRGPAVAVDGHQAARRRRQGRAAGRGRRDLRQGPAGDEGLLAEAARPMPQPSRPTAIFRTGDIGVFDEKGFLKIVDRKKDMIIVSGFNVYPNEVEAVAAACAGVAECACVGRPDEKTGEAVRLFVAKAPGASSDRGGRHRALPARTRSLQGAEGGAVPRRLPKSNGRQNPAQGSARASIGGTMALPNYSMATTPQFVGREFGVSDWVAVDQDRINQFAACTGDRQWIHVDVERATRESPFGGPIAHGYLTLSLVAATVMELGVDPARMPRPG